MAKKITKLPKRIAGYKIPKKVRKNSKPLLRLLDTPQFKGLLGAAVAAGAAALAGQSANGDSKGMTKKKAARRLKFLAAESKDRATEIAESVGTAVANAIGSHLHRKEQPEGATAH